MTALIKQIENAIENNLTIDFATSEELSRLELDTIVCFNKIWIYQIFSNSYVRF